MEKYDLIIVGAGPAGIFTAVELLRHGSKTRRCCWWKRASRWKSATAPRQNRPLRELQAPPAPSPPAFPVRARSRTASCPFLRGRRRPAHLIGEEFAQELIDYTDKIYLEFGADPHVEGIYKGEDIKDIRKRAIQAGLQLVDCPIRHLGTEKAQQLYLDIQNYLLTPVWRCCSTPSARTSCWKAALQGCCASPKRARPRLPPTRWSSPPAAAAPTGWKSSAPSTTSPTSPAPLTSACAWSAATRSWKR